MTGFRERVANESVEVDLVELCGLTSMTPGEMPALGWMLHVVTLRLETGEVEGGADLLDLAQRLAREVRRHAVRTAH